MDKEILKRPDKHTEIPACYLDGDKSQYSCLEISGNNYYPYFLNGDRVIFTLDLTKQNPTDIYLIEFNGKTEMRRIALYDTDEDFITVNGLTEWIPPETLAIGDYKIWGFPYMLIRKYTEGEKQCQP